MRVIAGEHRGRRLVAPDTDDTRPVTDRVKESIFSSLGKSVVGARVADLYAGAGSFGIEALSRGAESVVFVETGKRALEALQKNLEALDLEASVVRRRVEDFVVETADVFDLVFCDPPWPLATIELERVLEDVRVHLDSDAIVVVTRRASATIPAPSGFRIDDERRMGDTRIIRYANMDTP
jgi:16S rRNA (guanine966-N2)-methyltransferase